MKCHDFLQRSSQSIRFWLWTAPNFIPITSPRESRTICVLSFIWMWGCPVCTQAILLKASIRTIYSQSSPGRLNAVCLRLCGNVCAPPPHPLESPYPQLLYPSRLTLPAIRFLSFPLTLHHKKAWATSDQLKNAYYFQSNEEEDNEWKQPTEQLEWRRKHKASGKLRKPLNVMESDRTTLALWIFDHGCNMQARAHTNSLLNFFRNPLKIQHIFCFKPWILYLGRKR